MLLEFQCSNFRSILDTVTFSMRATSDTTREEYIKEYDKYRILKSAIVYGANGSGKSNFLKALAYMQGIIISNNLVQPGDKLPQETHKKADRNRPSEFSIQFIKNDHRYVYGFSIKDAKIENEYLYHFPKGRQKKVFEREGISLTSGPDYKKELENLESKLRDNRFVLSIAANESSNMPVREAFLFFKEDIVIYNTQWDSWEGYSAEHIRDDRDLKVKVLEKLAELDTGIKDIRIDAREINLADLFSGNVVSEFFKESFKEKTQIRYDIQMQYEDFEVDLAEESTGIQKLFGMLCPLIDILEKGKIFICDEFECGLHEAMAAHIIEDFQKYKNTAFAQMILSTHDTSLLSTKLYRRDQIWFTEMKKDRITDLYSLAEIKNVRANENFAKGYIQGRYGAIPCLDEKIFERCAGNRMSKNE